MQRHEKITKQKAVKYKEKNAQKNWKYPKKYNLIFNNNNNN